MDVKKSGNPGPTAYYVKYRPVFEAAPPGKPISPEFAGRFAAASALPQQLAARDNHAKAEHMLSLARGIYAMAKTTNVGKIVTTFPNDYYSGTEWKSDMLWGADEIALADEALHAPASQVHADLTTAAVGAAATSPRVTRRAATRSTSTTTGPSARASCSRRMRHAPGRHGRSSPAARSSTDLAAQLRLGEAQSANGDPFALGAQLGSSDATPARFRAVHHQRAVPAVRRRRADSPRSPSSS